MINDVSRVVIVRHGDVEAQWKGVCYGQRDVKLCELWMQNAEPLVEQLAALVPTQVFHSGLQRTRWLAERVSERVRGLNVTPIEDTRLRERHFGNWEGLSWNDAYESDPENFHDLIHKPDSYRPPQGETTTEMQNRVVDWYESIPRSAELLLAIAHSGPIAALAGHLLKLPSTQWQDWMLRTGEMIVIDRPLDDHRPIVVRRGFESGSVGQ